MDEHKIIVAILQHTLHRINEFLDENPAEKFAGLEPIAVSQEFVRWLRQKDADV